MFFHSLSFRFSQKQMLILSNIDLLILPTAFLAGFINLVVGRLTKFSLWSFKIIKQLLVPLISILSNISARFAYFMPSLFIISSIPFVAFLYFAVTALSRRWLYSSLVNIHVWGFVYRCTSVLFDDFIVFQSLFNFLWKLLFTLRNLIWCTKSIMSSSNAIRSFICGGHLLLLIPYLEGFSFCVPSPLFLLLPFMLFLMVLLFLFLLLSFISQKIAFHWIFLKNSLIFSINWSF